MMMVNVLGGGGWQWRCRSQCWPGQLGRTKDSRSERLGWLQVQVWVLAWSVEQGLGEQLRNRLWLRSARRQ